MRSLVTSPGSSDRSTTFWLDTRPKSLPGTRVECSFSDYSVLMNSIFKIKGNGGSRLVKEVLAGDTDRGVVMKSKLSEVRVKYPLHIFRLATF